MKIRTLSLLSLLAFAACSAKSPIAGNWTREGGPEGEKYILEFENGGTRVVGHIDDADGHRHIEPSPTYTFDAATMAVTVDGKLLGADGPAKWTGKLDGDHLELGAADTKLTFHKGGKAH